MTPIANSMIATGDTAPAPPPPKNVARALNSRTRKAHPPTASLPIFLRNSSLAILSSARKIMPTMITRPTNVIKKLKNAAAMLRLLAVLAECAAPRLVLLDFLEDLGAEDDDAPIGLHSTPVEVPRIEGQGDVRLIVRIVVHCSGALDRLVAVRERRALEQERDSVAHRVEHADAARIDDDLIRRCLTVYLHPVQRRSAVADRHVHLVVRYRGREADALGPRANVVAVQHVATHVEGTGGCVTCRPARDADARLVRLIRVVGRRHRGLHSRDVRSEEHTSELQ